MRNIDLFAAVVSIFIAISALFGAAFIGSEMRKWFKGGEISRVVRIFRKQSAKAIAEIRSLKKVRGILNQGKVRRELSEGTVLMRNRIAACDGARLTTDVMLEELMNESDVLKYPYARMLSLVRMEERRRAIREFAGLVKDKEAEEYAQMIVMLDDIEPGDVYESIVAFQKNMKEERITEIKKRDEVISDLLYLPVVFNLLLIFFNFLYVAYFMQQKDMLSFFM